MPLEVIRSSAGSGKTYKLVERYLSLALKSPDKAYFRHILAITFTNKATREMKERVLSALDGIINSQTTYKQLLESLSNATGLSETGVKEKSVAVRSELLHNYTEFSIMTIDRFVSRVIRSFAFELALPASTEIELDKSRIRKKSLDNLFASLEPDHPLTRVLVEFADYKFMTKNEFNLDRELDLMAREVMDPDKSSFVRDLEKHDAGYFTALRSRIGKSKAIIEENIRQKAKDNLSYINTLGLNISDLAGGSKGFFAKILDLTEEEFSWSEMPAAGKKAIDSGKWYSSSVNSTEKKIIEENSSELSRRAVEFSDLLESNRSSWYFCSIMISNIYSMAVAGEIGRKIREFKTGNGFAELSDFDRMIASLIAESPVPYIYERIGEKFHHYLIDEFQDTSKLQWGNFIPLIVNGISEGHASLLVGDAKQSIYRFRGADSDQITTLGERQVDEFHDIATLDASSIVVENLQENRRSSEVIVQFVNEFFEKVLSDLPDGIRRVYAGHIQIPKSEIKGGSVEIRFLEKSTEDEEHNELVISAMRNYHKAGYRWGDMAILCRKGQQCIDMTSLLLSEEIPVLSSEGMKLTASAEVEFIINWFNHLFGQGDDFAAFSILEFLLEHKESNSTKKDEVLKKWLEGKSLESILTYLYPAFDANSTKGLGLTETLAVLSSFFLDNASAHPFMISLADRVSEFESRYGNDGAEFLAWWSDRNEGFDLEMPGTVDSVKVMTVHKAKGLEFKIVLLPYLTGNIQASNHNFWLSTVGEDRKLMDLAWLPAKKDLMNTAYGKYYEEEMQFSLLDEVNLMYVAMTRAVSHLYIITDVKSTSENTTINGLLDLCFDLGDSDSSREIRIFRRGEIALNPKKSSDNEEVLTLSPPEDTTWRKRVRLRFRMDENILKEGQLSPSDYGNLVHNIMSSVRNLDELPAVLEKYVQSGTLSVPQSVEVIKGINQCLVDSPLYHLYKDFNGDIFNEREILSSNGKVLRPDKMAVSADEVILVDYKTGLPDESHDIQVKDYMNVIIDLVDKKISAYLVYFKTGEIRRVA